MIRVLMVVLMGAALMCTPVAWAGDGCGDFGGDLGTDGLCRSVQSTPEYTVDIAFPADFPDQDALGSFLVQTRDDFVEEAGVHRVPDRPLDLQIHPELNSSDLTRSVTFTVHQNFGGAHPTTWYRSFNYDLVRQNLITLDDLFGPDGPPLDVIFPIVQRDLELQTGVPGVVMPGEEMNPANYQNFAITPIDVVFYFDRGSLMAGAAGARTVRVPRSDIPPLVL